MVSDRMADRQTNRQIERQTNKQIGIQSDKDSLLYRNLGREYEKPSESK